MRQLSAFAVFLLFLCLSPVPVPAQHGAGHGGGGAHISVPSGHTGAPSGGLRSGSAISAPPRFSAGSSGRQPMFRPPVRLNGAPYGGRPGGLGGSSRLPYGSRPSYASRSAANARFRQPYPGNDGQRDKDRDHRRRGFAYGYWNSPYAIPYLYPYYGGWLNSGFSDDSYDSGNSDLSASSQPDASYDPNDPAYEPGYSPGYDDRAAASPDPANYSGPAPPYRMPYPNEPSARAEYVSPSAPALQPSVTLIFKDGRPAELIHNFILTSTTLTVLDRGRHDIPVDQIDLAATERTNRADGVQFNLPGKQ